jgi:hypothetical protein
MRLTVFSRLSRGGVKIADDGQKCEEWARHEGFISCHNTTYLVRQCKIDPSESAWLAISLDQQAWHLFGLERMPIAKPSWELI